MNSRMLETEDVDDDFFTPVAGTSLANIFGTVSKNIEATANDSLKYVPPKPQNTSPKPKQEQTKTTECIFACALIGHEWFNNVYTSRGKLGFAIVKIQRTGEHNIILYDSNKTTLSCATISTKLEVTIRNNTYISYYDNLKKYWSIYGTEEEIKKVTDQLTNFEVNIKYSTYIDQGPPEPTYNIDFKTNVTLGKVEKNEKESDTDSSVNRKTKASILNRMANMGHSVLPTRALPAERTSDSSDTMEIETQPRTTRHKTGKNVVKRHNIDIMTEPQHLSEPHQRTVVPQTESVENLPLYSSLNGQILPLTSTGFMTSTSNDLGLFISEQRISNSELRINMNRITDKVDSVLDKINNMEHAGNTNILMKLLTEYENKIKVYEELLQSSGDKIRFNSITSVLTHNNNGNEILKKNMSEIEKINQEKSTEVSNLQNEISLMKTKHAEEILCQSNKEAELLKQIKSLEQELKLKNEELLNLAKTNQTKTNTNISQNNIADKVKNIMNDTYQTISISFDDKEDYSGETIKKIIATVIKKLTIQTLSEL